jgi:hypothetical protein
VVQRCVNLPLFQQLRQIGPPIERARQKRSMVTGALQGVAERGHG